MKATLTPFGPSVLVDKQPQYRGRKLDFKEQYCPIKDAREQVEDAINDSIAAIEPHAGYMIARCEGYHKDAARQTYQGYINKAVALRDAWLKQCDLDREELLNG